MNITFHKSGTETVASIFDDITGLTNTVFCKNCKITVDTGASDLTIVDRRTGDVICDDVPFAQVLNGDTAVAFANAAAIEAYITADYMVVI